MLNRQFESDDPGTAVEGVNLSAPGSGATPTGDPWRDLDAYNGLPRVGGLCVSADGSRLVVSIARLNHDRTAFVSSLWAVDPAGEKPARRLTRSVEGDTAAAFLADGSLLFTSNRALPKDSDAKDTVKALWCLPADGGEAFTLARRDGGWGEVRTARSGTRAVFSVPTFAGVADEEADAKKRAARKTAKVAALLHEGYPVRYWDHDIAAESPRLLVADLAKAGVDEGLAPADFRPLGGDLGRSLSSFTLSEDGSQILAVWTTARPHGVRTSSIVVMDAETGERRTLAEATEDGGVTYGDAVFSRDARTVACSRDEAGTPTQAPRVTLCLIDVATGEERPLAPGWDRWATPLAFSPDGGTLYCSALDDGAEPIFAVDIASGQVRRLTADMMSYGSVVPSPDGATLYAVRTSWEMPGEVVAVDAATGQVRPIDCGVSYPAVPGRVERVETTAADGARVPGYLMLPAGADEAHPAPLALWIHGGPLSSWHAWSWRWCPWLLVQRGWAVLLPDPALSVGYGRDFIARGWGAWGKAPYTDLMAITDVVQQRPDVDETRTCAMGGSFGGYMANWIAGHTDRFRAIVTHAALWNLSSFGPTTDAAWYWLRELSPEGCAENSPHQAAANISTPMLVIHGDRDYRVPIGEGLALWWALNENWSGAPEEMPHRFLYFPDENHWILQPQHAKVWYETVFAFLGWHVLGEPFVKPELL